MAFSRSHIHLPVTGSEGNLLAYADVTFVDAVTGLASTAALYLTSSPDAEAVTSPVTFTPGIIDIWCETPVRFNLMVRGPSGFATTMYGIDLPVAPHDSAKASPGTPNEISTQSQTGRMLLSNGTTAYWGYLVQIEAHQHDGAMAGSTVLDLGVDEDAAINQTWVGHSAGGTEVGAVDSSALGSGATIAAEQSTLLGWGTGDWDGIGSVGDGAVALGAGSFALLNSVNFGYSGYADLDLAVNFGTEGTTGRVYRVSPDSLTLNNLIITDDLVGVCAIIDADTLYFPIPATPFGVDNPLWLRTDVDVPGTLTASGNVSLAGDGGSLGFYEHTGTTKTTIDAGASGALLSLLTALQAYGLLDLSGGS